MSLADSPDCFLRAEDRAMRMFYPAAEQTVGSTFDDFFNTEIHEGSCDERFKRQDSEESLELFPPNSGQEDDFSNPHGQPLESSPQPWRKGLWQLMVGKTRKVTVTPPSSVSPAHLLVNDNFAVRSPRSTTLHHETKSQSPSRLRQILCPDNSTEQSVRRGTKFSPSPMYPGLIADDATGYTEAWPQEFSDFNLQLNDDCRDLITIPHAQNAQYIANPPKQSSRMQTAVRSTRTQQRAATTGPYRGNETRYNPHHTAHELSHVLNANIYATENNTFCNESHQYDSRFHFISEDPISIAGWTTDSVHSSNSSQVSQNSQEARMSETLATQNWWSPPAIDGHNLIHQASRDDFPMLVQPQPRRVTHNVLGHDHVRGDVSSNTYPSLEQIGIAIPYQPPEPTEPSTPIHFLNYANSPSSFPALPPPVGYDFDNESPFTTPRRARALIRTPSPPLSPTHKPARSNKQRSPSRRDTSSHRRKSIHKFGPMKDAETPRHRSTSRPPRTPKTPKTPHYDGLGSMGFVNFTPKDASKLLNDVAPSGSSKTRARREQEARDKRKKLSEAALNAVREAGGDVKALERAILI